MPNNSRATARKAQQAQDLANLLEAKYGARPEGKPYYSDFDSYVADVPEGETFRAWLTNENRCPVVLFLMSEADRKGAPHGGLPGHYLALSVSEFRGEVVLSLHDCDDGLAQRRFAVADRAAADSLIQDMKQLAPFTMWEAVEHFGLSWS